MTQRRFERSWTRCQSRGCGASARLAGPSCTDSVTERSRTCGPPKRRRFAATLGSWGGHLWKLANGIDARAVVPDRRAKGIGHERTFETDLTEIDDMLSVVSYLAEQVGFRLRRAGRLASVVSIKYRREDFRTFNRSKKLAAPTDATATILDTAAELLRQMRGRQPRGVRLLGVRLTSLSPAGAPMQLSLFGATDGDDASQAADRLTDAVTDRLGKHQIYRASSHGWVNRKG